MAQLKYGAIVTDIKGKIGGIVFQGGKQGPVAKLDAIADSAKLTKADAGRVINTLPLTASIAGAWRQLSDIQRASWVTGAVNYPAYNKFGTAYTPSGFQVFMTLNFQIVAMAGSLLTECPVPVTVPDLIDYNIGWTPSTSINLVFAMTPPADCMLRIEATQPMSLGRAPKNSFYKVIDQLDNTITSPHNLFTKYVAVYGAVPANAVLYFRLMNVSTLTGQKGVPMIIIVTT